MTCCSNCSAPLPIGTIRCDYCGSRQDVDLQGWALTQAPTAPSDLHCPECGEALLSFWVQPKRSIELNRCPTCLGLFLPADSLEEILHTGAIHPMGVNVRLLASLAEHPRQNERNIRYRPYPICLTLMNRKAFGKLSGVIIDSCRGHGVWLDAGELRQLLEWARAGGLLHNAQLLGSA